jgi:pheromone shutdown protein TraB
VEGLKQRDVEKQVADVMKAEVPVLFEALVGERDRYMAHSIYTSEAAEMVAVVGAMHTGGMEDELIGKYNFTKFGCFNSTRITETMNRFHMPIVS